MQVGAGGELALGQVLEAEAGLDLITGTVVRLAEQIDLLGVVRVGTEVSPIQGMPQAALYMMR